MAKSITLILLHTAAAKSTVEGTTHLPRTLALRAATLQMKVDGSQNEVMACLSLLPTS